MGGGFLDFSVSLNQIDWVYIQFDLLVFVDNHNGFKHYELKLQNIFSDISFGSFGNDQRQIDDKQLVKWQKMEALP